MISFKVQMLFTVLAIIRQRKLSHESLNWRNEWYKTYDYIVVGTGAAGSVVAARLADKANKCILLIEAGGTQTVATDIPGTIGTEYDWNYSMVPQKHAYWAFTGNQRNIARGRAFGGSTMHNGMNFYRESPEYFQFWSELTGVQNWTYSHVLPYFMKSENNLDQSLLATKPKVHRKGGPITLTNVIPDPITRAYIKASELKGYPITYSDGRKPFGTTIFQKNVKRGVRQSTSLAFLEHNHRNNLHILGQTLVTKIVFNEKKRAIGVQFFRDNTFHTVFVRNEVILSAGVIESPHLLMLSGIGPDTHLNELGIPVISNLQVGNFWSSLATRFQCGIKNQSLFQRPPSTFKDYYDYFVHGNGPLNTSMTALTNFRQLHYPGHPNLTNGFSMYNPSFVGTNLDDLVKEFKLKEEWKIFYRPYLNQYIFLVGVFLQKSQQKGTIRLASKDPFQYPIIDPCILCSERDLDDLVKTFKLVLDIILSPYMKQFIEIFKNPIPGCNPCPNHYFCDSYIRCYIHTYTHDINPMGGCRIGIASDSEAVVDSKLRVLGVSGLRVVDSSIIPVHTSQSTATTVMIGEYGSDLIKNDY